MKKCPSLPRAAFLTLACIALAASIGLWGGCSEETGITNVAQQANDQQVVLDKAAPGVKAVMATQDRSTNALMGHPEVVGTGTGLGDNGELAVVVYTMSPVPQKGAFTSATLENVPALDAIPQTIDGLPVKVKVTGKFVIHADPTARFARPVPIGVSTGHPDITAGTIGCRVRDGQENVYALSNNHIYANSNDASIGDNALQPGPSDGGQDPEDAIGTLYDYEPIKFDGSNNYMDAAIAVTSTGNVGTSTPSGDGYGTPNSTIVDAYLGQPVQKYGRTTGWTQGEVAELNVTVTVCYEGFIWCTKSATFADQISITPGEFSGGGDSGSLIVTDDSNKNPVGLLFAGSSDRTIANPIGYVLNRFNVTIDDGSGGTTNNPPTSDFTYTTTDLTVDFTDQSTDSDGSVVGWSWDFGDGATSTSQNPSHTYGADGTYTVSLTVTDDDGATGTSSQDVTVSGGGTTNNPPSSDFTYTTTDLTVDFTDQSTDSDGSVVGWSWDFGDGATSTSQNPSHTYGADGTYTVSLTVTDDDGATGTSSQDVTVSSGSTGDITLTATGYKVRGRKHADLEWSGATGTQVEIYRDGALIATTDNDGFYTDSTNQVGGGSFTYQVCEIGGSPCSNEATVSY